MFQYQEREIADDRKPGRKTRVKEIGLNEEDILGRAKWKKYIQNHSGDPGGGRTLSRIADAEYYNTIRNGYDLKGEITGIASPSIRSQIHH